MFDPCQHKLTLIVLKAGALIRSLRGLEPESNITSLYNETAPMLGLVAVQTSSSVADHLPRPGEMKDDKGKFIVPRQTCPVCGGVMVLGPICQSCKDAEGGKYKTGFKCEVCQFVTEKSEKFFIQRLADYGVEIPTGTKEEMGILTLTDNGLE